MPTRIHCRRDFLHTGLVSALMLALPPQVWARSPGAGLRDRLAFGIVPYLPARRLVTLFAPLVPVLESVLGRPVDIVSAPDYPEHLDRMRAGAYDVVADALLHSRIMQREHGHIPIARTKVALEPLLVVPQSPRPAPLAALRGQTVAVTDRTASISVIGLRFLRDQGLLPDRDLRILVSGTHANSLHRLLAGDAAAAIVSRTALQQVDASLAQQVRVLHTLPQGLSSVVYHVAPRLADQAQALSAAVLQFAGHTPAGQAFIAALGHAGLVPALNSEMQTLDPLVVEFYRQTAQTMAK